MTEVKLVVTVSGGLIRDIFSNVPAQVLILDCDTEGFDRLKTIRDWDFKKGAPTEETFKVFDAMPLDASVNPAAVNHFFNEMEESKGGDNNAL
ncbi:MAG: hypothetical protein KGZ49_02860 [Syntrophaceae bacterium]|nr:hypothetical protein [Syntrophaceae bacterium]